MPIRTPARPAVRRWEEALLQENILTCSSCARRYDLRSCRAMFGHDELHLAPLPLLVEKDGMKIAVATER